MPIPGDSEKVTNLEVATRQVVTAIKLFFANGDPIAVHTLACAAREIYEKHCKAADITRTFDYVKESNAHLSEKQLWNILNGPRNFFKHPADHLNASIEFSDEYNDFMILSAVHDHGMLKGQDQPIEMQTYGTWFLTVKEHMAPPNGSPSEIEQAERITATLDRLFPGIRQASRAEQKAFGARMLELALAGKFP
jgi:hypothetical protein